MKIYTNTFDLSRPSPHRFWVAPFSDFKFGIKLVNAGAEVENTFTVTAGTTTLTPDADKIDGFTIYTTKSTDTGFVEYTITVNGIQQRFKLIQIITDSTVFEVGGEGGGGGDIPSDLSVNTLSAQSVTANSASIRTVTSPGNFEASGANVDVTAHTGDALINAADDISISAAGSIQMKTNSDEFVFENGNGDLVTATVSQISAALNGGDVPEDVATKTWVNSQISDFVEQDDLTGYATTEDLSSKADKIKKIPADVSWWETTGWWFYDDEENQIFLTQLTSNFISISEYCDYQVSSQYVPDNSSYNIYWDSPLYYRSGAIYSNCTNGKTVYTRKVDQSYVEDPDYEGNISGNISVYYEIDTTQIPDGEGFSSLPDEAKVEGTVKWLGYVSENMDGQAPYILQELPFEGDGFSYYSSINHAAIEHVIPGYVSADVVYEDSISSLASKEYLQMNYPSNETFWNSLDDKVSTYEVSQAPKVQQINTYYESEYAQLSVDDPDWSPDQNTMYVILPDPE